MARRRVINEMKEAGAHGKPDPDRDAPTLKQLREHGEAIDRLDDLLSGFKGWQEHTTSPDAVLILRTLGQRARDAVGRLADDAPTLVETRSKVRTLLFDGNDLLAPEASVWRAAQDFLMAHRRLQEDCDAFEAIAGQSVREHFAENLKALEAIQGTADTITRRHAELKVWCGWWRRRTEAIDLELGPLVNAIENGDVPIDEIETAFEAAYCSWWSGAVIGEDKVLRNFSTPEHVANIKKFREIDDQFQKLTAAYIGAKLAGCLPSSDNVTRKSSWGVLRHELQKKTKHKAVRQLMEEIPDVLTTLAPCLMMSPLSVAQYLAADQALFDVVIFDEASQITVWDAVGCLARGRQAIVVGDPKQMPTTNFFARTDDDPDGDIDMEGDLESILDEMLGASIPKRTLSLHYRSRKESLIAFSNSRYYDNQLITFPAPVHPDHAIQLIRPNGFYARGKARHNEGEAKAIVSEILRRLTHEDPPVREKSIGVVTFNSEQQTLIENLLDDARSRNPAIEWAFASDRIIEPVFVKNLETVQGDERDVILFSITYGPDQSNHVTMNFGPLNRDGGERRLNVAMTRARFEMLVFSTLSPDRIDLSRTQAPAVADLKLFLEYAERRPAALGAAVHGSMGDFESPFEIAVARALRDKGWDVRPQIGVSAYRIDLGIVHPDKPGVYLAGVECDGAMYHSSAFARERDKIRQSVLEGLGWTLFRVWSTDWWTHRAKALETLHQKLTLHLETDRQKREEAAQSLEGRAEESPSGPSLVDDIDEESVAATLPVELPIDDASSSVSDSADSDMKDETRCLNHILQQIVSVEVDGRRFDRTLGNLIANVFNHLESDDVMGPDDAIPPPPDKHIAIEDAVMFLKRHGIRLKDGFIYISDSHKEMKKLFKDTAWHTGWKNMLLRIDRSKKTKSLRFEPGTVTRAVGIPLNYIFGSYIGPLQNATFARRTSANTPTGETPFLRTPEHTSSDLFGDIKTCYVVSHLDRRPYRADPVMFYSEEYSPRLRAMIDHVIDIEGPIHEDVLVRRIARHHGFRSAEHHIRDTVIKIAKLCRGRSKEDVGFFFWRKGTVKDRLTPARYKGRNDEMRKIEYICKEEIRAIRESLCLNDDPIELARRIGITRLSQSARKRLTKAMHSPRDSNA